MEAMATDAICAVVVVVRWCERKTVFEEKPNPEEAMHAQQQSSRKVQERIIVLIIANMKAILLKVTIERMVGMIN